MLENGRATVTRFALLTHGGVRAGGRRLAERAGGVGRLGARLEQGDHAGAQLGLVRALAVEVGRALAGVGDVRGGQEHRFRADRVEAHGRAP